MALTYTLDGNNATITGSDPSAEGDLVIPATIGVYNVVAIGEGAFDSNTDITSLTLPEGLLTIGTAAFSSCANLTGNLAIPNSVTEIGDSAFDSCSNLTSIYASGNAPTAGEDCFYSVSAPLYVGSAATGWVETFDDLTVYKINYTESSGNATITGTTPSAVGGLFIPDVVDGYNVTAIGDSAFDSNTDITSLTLPEGLLTIGDYAFNYCSSFTGDLVIPNSVTSIGDYTFENCYGFTGNLVIGNSVTTIGENAFQSCSGFAGYFTIGNSVTSIGDYAFANCSGLTGNLVIPNSVTSIGGSAFQNCSGFAGYFTIGNSVTTIGENVFAGCSSLTGDLVIPNSVISIGNIAFAACSNLTSAWFGGNLPGTLGSNIFDASGVTTIYRFSAATGWDTTLESIPVVTIPYTEASESNVAIGEAYGLGGSRTGTKKKGKGINGSDILGFA